MGHGELQDAMRRRGQLQERYHVIHTRLASSFPSNSANDSGDACESRGGGFGPGSQRDFSDLKILITNVRGLRQGCGE